MQDQQVTIVLEHLTGGKVRSPETRYRVHELINRLTAAVERHGVGVFVGQEIRGEELLLRFQGPNANRLYKVIRGPLLAALPGGFILKRHGPAGVGAKEEKAEFYPPLTKPRGPARSRKVRL